VLTQVSLVAVAKLGDPMLLVEVLDETIGEFLGASLPT
jgi:hypothetical protein